MPSSQPDKALAYLASRDALHKLQTPVFHMFGCPRHGESYRRRRAAFEDRQPGLLQRLFSRNK